MVNIANKAPFLGEMRQKWQSGVLTPEQVLSEVLRWEEDINQRTDEELDEAWAFRQEVEDSYGLKSASDLQVLLDTSAVQHIDSVMRDLETIASAGRLNDTYERVIQTVIHEGGPRYAQSVGQLLSGMPIISPALQSILTSMGGGAATSVNVPDDEEGYEVVFDEEDEVESNTSGSSQSLNSQSQPKVRANPGTVQDPWLLAQRLINLGRWEDARQAVAEIPIDHPRADEIPSVLAGIDEGEIYDQVPGLRNMLGALASSRSRRDWAEFKRRRGEAEKLIMDASAQVGKPIQMPRSLSNIFDEAIKAQDAEALVVKAVQERERGDFPGAATSLTEALTLDPRYARVQSEQQINADLQDLLYGLRRNPLNSATELAHGLAICEQLLESNAAPGSLEVSNRRDTILSRIDKLIETIRRRIDGRQKVIKDPGDLDQKLNVCDALDHQLDEIESLRKDDQDLQDLRDWTDSTRRKLRDLITERDAIGNYTSNLDPSVRVDGAASEKWNQRLDLLLNEPIVQGDSTSRTLSQNLTGKLSSYLDTILHPGMAIDLPTLENAAEVLRLAQSGPKGLTSQQITGYSRSLWVAGSSLVRSLLPKALPPYEPPQSGQSFTPRSAGIIGSWDQALRVLEWLRNLPSAMAEQQTIEALERDFALSVTQILETNSNFPRKITKDESEERVVTARTIKQYIQTLPQSIRDKIAPQVLTSKRTQTESVVRRKRTLAVLIPVVLALLILSILGVGGATVKKIIDDNNATATAVAQAVATQQTATAIARNATAVAEQTVSAKATIAEQTRIAGTAQDIRPYVVAETNRNNADCVFVSNFNVCDTGSRKFRTWYLENKDFLGAPITQEFEDFQVSAWVQYFGMGRLEWSEDSSGSIPTFGLLGDDVLRAMAPNKPNLKAAQAQVAKPQSGCKAVPGYPHWLCFSFLDFYQQGLGGKDPVYYYGYPITEEYQDSFKGDEVPRQFFQRAVFQGVDGKVERLPLGLLYLNWVRENGLRGEYLPIPAGVNIDAADVHPQP